MDIQKEREAFEVYLLSQGVDLKYLPCIYFNGTSYDQEDGDVDYQEALGEINLGWNAWQAAKASAVPEWISVENKLPKRNIKVLLNIVARRRGKPFSCIGFYSVEPDDEPCFILDDNFTILKGVTHWMQLPQAPKAQEPSHD